MKVMPNLVFYSHSKLFEGFISFLFSSHKCVLLIENLKKKTDGVLLFLTHSDKIFQMTRRLNNLINYFLDSKKCAGLIDLSNQRGLKLSRSVPEKLNKLLKQRKSPTVNTAAMQNQQH